QQHGHGDAVAIGARQARAAAARWCDGGPRRIDRDAMALALGVVTETLLGARVDGDDRLGASGAPAVRGGAARRPRGWAPPAWLPTPSARRMRRGMRGVRAFVDRAIAASAGGGLAARLADAAAAGALSARAVRDELAVSLCLGAHQIALALAWALHLV